MTCPTPHKAQYRDEVAAKVALAKVQRQDKREARRALHTAQAARDSGVQTRRECRYYHCPCGSWHLTSRPAQEEA